MLTIPVVTLSPWGNGTDSNICVTYMEVCKTLNCSQDLEEYSCKEMKQQLRSYYSLSLNSKISPLQTHAPPIKLSQVIIRKLTSLLRYLENSLYCVLEFYIYFRVQLSMLTLRVTLSSTVYPEVFSTQGMAINSILMSTSIYIYTCSFIISKTGCPL